MLDDKPPSSKMSSFSKPFNIFRKRSKPSRLASKDENDKIFPADAASPSSQAQSDSQTDSSLPTTTTKLLTALHASLIATPPPDRKLHIETLQKLLNTISRCPELTSNTSSESESKPPTNAITSLSIFHKKCYEYITKGVREDGTTVVFVREEGCEFCKAVKSGSSQSSKRDGRMKARLSKAEWTLVDNWRRERVCLCGGEEQREKEKREGLVTAQVKTHTDLTQSTTGQTSEQEQQQEDQERDLTVAPTKSPPSTPASSPTKPEITPKQERAHQERERLRQLRMEERLQLRDAELRLLVPEDKRPPVYGWDQPPGLDGYSATQEREEEYGYLAKYCSTLNPRSNRYSNSDYTGERISDLDSDDEESRPRGRSLTRRERTGYGVPYGNNGTNGTTSYISHQDSRSEFCERTGYGVPYNNSRSNGTTPYTSHYTESSNRSNGTTPHPATLNLQDSFRSSPSRESRTHTPSNDSLSRPSQGDRQHTSHLTTPTPTLLSSSTAAYTMPSGGLRSYAPTSTSSYTSTYTPSPLQSALYRLTSTGTGSRSTSSYIAPRHPRYSRTTPGTIMNKNNTPSNPTSNYPSSYYTSQPSSSSQLASSSSSGASSSTNLSTRTDLSMSSYASSSMASSGRTSATPSTSTSISTSLSTTSRKASRDHGDRNGNGGTRKP